MIQKRSILNPNEAFVINNFYLILLSFLFCLFTGCMSPHNASELKIIRLTEEYLNSESKEDRQKLIPEIEKAFANFHKNRYQAFKITDLPPDIKKSLMKDIDSMGFGAKEPKWEIAYSCNGFHYIIEFTCLVKRKKVSSDKGKNGKWIYDKARNYFLFNGVPLVDYPVLKEN